MGKITKLTLSYRGGVLPAQLGSLLDNADENDLKVLVALQMLADPESGVAPVGELASLLGCSEAEASASLKFWRGAGVLTTAGNAKAPKEQKEAKEQNEQIRFDFSAGTAEITKLADGDLSRTNVFAKIAIRQILKLSMSELPKKLTIPFELELEKVRYGS